MPAIYVEIRKTFLCINWQFIQRLYNECDQFTYIELAECERGNYQYVGDRISNGIEGVKFVQV